MAKECLQGVFLQEHKGRGQRKLDHSVKKVAEYLNREFGAALLVEQQGLPYVDEQEKLICCFSFPDGNLRKQVIGNTSKDFPDIKLLFICNLENQEIFSRVCQGEARGISWNIIEMLCETLRKSF